MEMKQHFAAVDESLGARMAAENSSNGSGGGSKKREATSATKPEVMWGRGALGFVCSNKNEKRSSNMHSR